ncbi:SDR family NAD(P)-dependent oxidoreductase [Rubrivivax benzoatilyticus]|uniref:SDR family NAD(P)-dependent oxidoreductase n=1 Tax=Rubrivivax benzoatilyticus TaxID=316997 RepID=A0ABX0HT77_9BURK|nr:SDR family NAD(P)-dependent oxidoreductase [Rubrivivax benzoatilyticus]EGJ11996.1 short-chain dehydrogenase/reductase SDR [Rubrivivax benzoatilyticus JA2 = ATCC BAA-35]NHK97516.1 SDR family NAD(P)-dependent oxidoreductase [Rubrivivax benzoatilyticus]NHL22789.1 SDR family NAD(P)-dependent oxidoreductase [Rubrivivax benzoatilyticus]
MLEAMKTSLTLVTGGSRGLGLALVQQLLERGDRVLTLARRAPPLEHPALIAWTVDLADPAPAARRLSAWLDAQDPGVLASVTLVNNAGVISELAPLGEVGAADLSNALRVGLEAPMLLASAFLRSTAAWNVPRKLLFVSSGLGRRAMAGSASYCAAKAGMDHLARAIALEEAARPNGARVVSLAPGVIDTDMQVQLRSADPARFTDRGRFVGLHEGGMLDSPETAAAKLLRYLERADFGQQPVADVRDA